MGVPRWPVFCPNSSAGWSFYRNQADAALGTMPLSWPRRNAAPEESGCPSLALPTAPWSHPFLAQGSRLVQHCCLGAFIQGHDPRGQGIRPACQSTPTFPAARCGVDAGHPAAGRVGSSRHSPQQESARGPGHRSLGGPYGWSPKGLKAEVSTGGNGGLARWRGHPFPRCQERGDQAASLAFEHVPLLTAAFQLH